MIMCEKLLVGSGHKWKLQDGEIEVNEFHDRTRIDLSLSEISDEADNGQKELNCSLETNFLVFIYSNWF